MQASGLLQRLRWDLGEETIPSRDPATIARTYIYLYGLGATLVLASLAFPAGGDRHEPAIYAVCAAACAVSAVLLFGFDRLPGWVLPALSPLGTVLITVLVAADGADSLLYATFYFWSVLSTASLFSTRATIWNIVFVGACYATVLIAVPGAAGGQAWLMVIATLSVIAAVTLVLRHKLEVLRERSLKQAKVAELGRFALAQEDVAKLYTLAANAVTEALGVDRAGVFRFLDGENELVLRAGAGADGVEALPTLGAKTPLALAALGSWEPVQLNGELAVAVRRGEGALGVLVAYGGSHRRFKPSDSEFIKAIAHVIGEATERRRVAAEREHLAMHDHLTGRPNRLHFTDRLRETMDRARDGGAQFAVYFLDLDDFKRVNDSYGHRLGDEVLKAVGPRLRGALVMTDTVARFGGDEFAVLCEDVVSEAQAIEIGSRLRAALHEPFRIGGAEHRIGASIGIVLSDGDAEAEELIADADAAMYRAKERTRGGFEFFDSSLRQRVLMRLEYENALRAAPERGELSLAIQPIVSLPAGEPVGSEALLRWEHPKLGRVSPAEFIPIAEQTGAILPLGEWTLREAFSLAARWRSDERRRYLPLYVNLSPRQLVQPNFVRQVDAQFDATGARRRDLGFEITEHVLIRDTPGTVEALEHLQETGSSIVLDDFGTGYSSLSHLKRFPIDVVKIDRNFISDLEQQDKDKAIVSAIVGMAEAFALDVVAEGIESAEQATLLAELGCRYGQGFWFSRPIPVADLEVTLSRQGARLGPDAPPPASSDTALDQR